METEYKYRLTDRTVFDSIVKDREIVKNDTEVEVINMIANYFDTDESDLLNRGVAYRIRHENDRITATIKWDKDVTDGLHIREEFNLVVNDDRYAESPDIGMFKSSDAYEVLFNASGDKKLVKKIGMEYERKQIRVDTGKSISCISIDEGIIHHVKGYDVPILELEIEWFHGAEDDFKALAHKVQEKYGLETEDISKLQRAFI